MHDFDGRGELSHPFPSHPSQGFVGGEDERRAQAFAFAQQAVPDDCVFRGHRRQHRIDTGPGVGEIAS
jgi:hypothetical protein